MSATPSGTEPLELDEEHRDIETELKGARLRESFDLRPAPTARIDASRITSAA